VLWYRHTFKLCKVDFLPADRQQGKQKPRIHCEPVSRAHERSIHPVWMESCLCVPHLCHRWGTPERSSLQDWLIFAVLGLELRTSHLLHRHPYHSASLFCVGIFNISSLKLSPGWLQTAILLISASWVGRITGMSHRFLAHSGFIPDSNRTLWDKALKNTNNLLLWITRRKEAQTVSTIPQDDALQDIL
jgi:hypothetical protein